VTVTLADEIAGRVGSGVEVLTGSIATVNATTVDIYLGGHLHAGKLLSCAGYIPIAGDPVLVLRQGARLDVVGPVTGPLPRVCTVTKVPGLIPTVIEVTVPGYSTVELPFLGNYTPVVGDQVAVDWRGGIYSGLVLDTIGTTLPPPVAVPPPPPPPTAPITGNHTFQAVDVGTYRSGWRTDDNGDVIQGTYGTANEGAWFYGGQPRGTLAGVTVTGLSIWLGRTSGGVYAAQNMHAYWVADNWQPGGALTWGAHYADVALSVGQEGWFGLPASLGQALVDSGGSIGIKGAPYMRMYGLSKSGMAGAIRIDWRR
jgi:hypothetical protein